MTVPLVGVGHDLVLAALVPFVVEPQTGNGVSYAQRDFGADGSIHETGLFCPLLWPVIEDDTQLIDLLTQLGLEEDGDQRAAVSVYLPTKRRIWHVYNAWALAPAVLPFGLWTQNLRIMLNKLVLTA